MATNTNDWIHNDRIAYPVFLGLTLAIYLFILWPMKYYRLNRLASYSELKGYTYSLTSDPNNTGKRISYWRAIFQGNNEILSPSNDFETEIFQAGETPYGKFTIHWVMYSSKVPLDEQFTIVPVRRGYLHEDYFQDAAVNKKYTIEGLVSKDRVTQLITPEVEKWMLKNSPNSIQILPGRVSVQFKKRLSVKFLEKRLGELKHLVKMLSANPQKNIKFEPQMASETSSVTIGEDHILDSARMPTSPEINLEEFNPSWNKMTPKRRMASQAYIVFGIIIILALIVSSFFIPKGAQQTTPIPVVKPSFTKVQNAIIHAIATGKGTKGYKVEYDEECIFAESDKYCVGKMDQKTGWHLFCLGLDDPDGCSNAGGYLLARSIESKNSMGPEEICQDLLDNSDVMDNTYYELPKDRDFCISSIKSNGFYRSEQEPYFGLSNDSSYTVLDNLVASKGQVIYTTSELSSKNILVLFKDESNSDPNKNSWLILYEIDMPYL